MFGPTQVIARILANREISSLVSLLNREGSRVILGNLLIVPIKDSLLYVQPLFVQGSAENSIPLLTNVAVFYNNQVGFADDLSGALAEVIKGAGCGLNQDMRLVSQFEGGFAGTASGIDHNCIEARRELSRLRARHRRRQVDRGGDADHAGKPLSAQSSLCRPDGHAY